MLAKNIKGKIVIPLKIIERLGKAGVFDIAKTLHYFFPRIFTERIYNLILQLDSVDQAIVVLNGHKEDNINIDEAVYLILKYRDENK